MSLSKVVRNLGICLAMLFGLATPYGSGKVRLPPKRETTPGSSFSRSGPGSNEVFRGQAQDLLELAEVQNHTDHVLGLQTAQQALSLWQSLNDDSGIAQSHDLIARIYLAQNSLNEATNHCQAALEIWRRLNNQEEQAETLIMLGNIEDRKGEWENSISFFTQAQSLVDEKAKPDTMGRIASGFADVFNESGLPEQGLVQSQRALSYYQQAGNPVAVAMTRWVMGTFYYRLENFAEASSQLQQALDGIDQEKDPVRAAVCYEYLGRVLAATAKYDAAFQYLQTALTVYERAGNQREAARVRAFMGQVDQQLGRSESAVRNYRWALDTFSRVGDRINQSAMYYALGRLALDRNELDVAEDYLKHSIDVTEDIRQVSTSRDLTTAFSATVHERYARYIECLMRKNEIQPALRLSERAFEISELARGRSLTELLRATQTNLIRKLDPKLAAQEKELRQSLKWKEDYRDTLLTGNYSKDELDTLNSEIKQKEAQYPQLVTTIRARFPLYDEITRPTVWNLHRIQEQILADDQTLLLEFSLSGEQGYVWVVSRNEIRSYKLPAASQINEAAAKVYRLVTKSRGYDQGQLTQATEELSRMILLPVASHLNKRRIIVVADGALHYIPFQLLPEPEGKRELLIEKYEVINAPSASILGQLRQERSQREPTARLLAAFGDPVFASDQTQRPTSNNSDSNDAQGKPLDPRWQTAVGDIEVERDSFDASRIEPLFYAKLELANLRKLVGHDSLFATGFEATNERLQSTDLTKYKILHLATHGILDPRRPEISALMLSTVRPDGQSQNGFFALQDVYALHAPVDLVVLSACRSGLGRDVRGEGLIGLTRGFMYAGASSVVSSLWSVDDESTAELMKRFYTNMLQQGMTPAAALRAAQNSIRQEPQWSSPYFWAAFTLQGEYQEIIKPPPAAGMTALYKISIACAVTGLIAALAWRYRRRRLMRG